MAGAPGRAEPLTSWPGSRGKGKGPGPHLCEVHTSLQSMPLTTPGSLVGTRDPSRSSRLAHRPVSGLHDSLALPRSPGRQMLLLSLGHERQRQSEQLPRAGAGLWQGSQALLVQPQPLSRLQLSLRWTLAAPGELPGPTRLPLTGSVLLSHFSSCVLRAAKASVGLCSWPCRPS